MTKKKKDLQSCTLAFVHAGRYATPVNLLLTLPGSTLHYPDFVGVGGGVLQNVQKGSLSHTLSRSRRHDSDCCVFQFMKAGTSRLLYEGTVDPTQS